MPVAIVVVAKSAQIRARDQIRAREGKPNSLRRKLQQLDCDGVSSRDRQLGVSVTGAVPKLARRISMQRAQIFYRSRPEKPHLDESLSRGTHRATMEKVIGLDPE